MLWRRFADKGVRWRFLLRLQEKVCGSKTRMSTGSSRGKPNGQFVVVEEWTQLLCRVVAVPVAETLGGSGAHGEILVGESVDQSFVNRFSMLLSKHVDSGGAPGITTVFVDVVDGLYTEPEGPQKEAGALEDAEPDERSGTVQLLGGLMFFGFDRAELVMCFAGGNGEKKILAGAVVHLPQRGCGSVGDLWVGIVQRRAKPVISCGFLDLSAARIAAVRTSMSLPAMASPIRCSARGSAPIVPSAAIA